MMSNSVQRKTAPRMVVITAMMIRKLRRGGEDEVAGGSRERQGTEEK